MAQTHTQHCWQPWLQQQPYQQPALPAAGTSVPRSRACAELRHEWPQLQQPPAPSAQPMQADSVRRKRKTKMNKHKHRKRLKKMRQGGKK